MRRKSVILLAVCGLAALFLFISACKEEGAGTAVAPGNSENSPVEDCTTNARLCQPCPEGSITASCLCGGTVQADGFCCSGTHQDTMCSQPVQTCPEGAIAATCQCGGIVQTDGFCCSGTHQDTLCSQPVQACAEGAITATCQCGGTVQTDGFCCSGTHQDTLCSQPVQACAEGAITQSCQCGGTVQTDGFCCSGIHQDTMCGQPVQACAEGAITATCQCGGIVQTDGFCCSGIHQDTQCDSQAQPLAFPGVEGFGAHVSGGRGGQVIKVTTLQPTGPGSLDEALRTPGPRIVVFAVSGVINGDFDITEPDITIAGQTAPGAGISIVGRLWAPFAESDGSSRVRNIIIRHLRVRNICRPGMPDDQCDTMRLSSQSRFVLDHVSLSWGVDEILDLWGGSHDWTIQDSTFEHPCLNSSGSATHAYGVLNRRGGRGSILRTAMLNCRDRNPAFADGPFDIINMVVYNHQTGLTHHNPASGAFNVIGNYYRKGSSGGVGKPFWIGGYQNATAPSFWFFDNYLDDRATNPFGRFDDPWLANHTLLGESGMGGVPDSHRAPTRHDYSGYSEWVAPTVLSSVDAYDHVLRTAGAFPRDIVTRTAISEARDRTGAFGCPIRQQLDAQGNASGPHPLMDGLTPTTPPMDNDNDGMADTWEMTHGLNPAIASDHSRVMTNGYTAIENYINELAEQLVP